MPAVVVELEAGEEITSEVGNIGQGTYINKNQDKRWHRKGIVKDVWWRRHDRYRCNRSGKGLYSNNVTAKTWRDAYTVYKG